jgi:hypothetical protein
MGKQILPKTDFSFKTYDKKLVFLRRMGSLDRELSELIVYQSFA